MSFGSDSRGCGDYSPVLSAPVLSAIQNPVTNKGVSGLLRDAKITGELPARKLVGL